MTDTTEGCAMVESGNKWGALVAFLRARLDEDLVVIHREHYDYDCDCGSDVVPTRADCPARWAADLTAKRAIMRRVAALTEGLRTGVADSWAEAVERAVLLPMAAVYADHPDYQQEWALPHSRWSGHSVRRRR